MHPIEMQFHLDYKFYHYQIAGEASEGFFLPERYHPHSLIVSPRVSFSESTHTLARMCSTMSPRIEAPLQQDP